MKHNVTLIEVPHWWDKKSESLAVTIHKTRSDLIDNPPAVDPIPELNPTLPKEDNAGDPLSHGCPWDGNQDLTGW